MLPHATPIIQKQMDRIIRAWRVKIKRSLEPGTKFNVWHVLDCKDPRRLVKHIERSFVEGMTWENYGTDWQMMAVVDRTVVTLEDLYQKHYFKNFVPKWKTEDNHLSIENVRRPFTRQPREEESYTNPCNRDSGGC